MNRRRALVELSRAYLLETARSKTAVVWNVVFPLFWLFLFGLVFARNGAYDIDYFMPGLFTINIIAGSFFGVSYLMVMEREAGILRRYRVTPVTATTVVLANVVRSLALLAFSLAVQGVMAWLVFDIQVVGSLATVVLAMLVGSLAFIPLGLIVGSVAADMRSAPAITNVIFLPLVFATGAAIPFDMLPGWVQAFARVLPSTYLVEALQRVMVRGRSLAEIGGPMAVLLLTGVLGAGLNGLLFRWESSQPVDRRRLAGVLIALSLLFAAAAAVGPELVMEERPALLRRTSEVAGAGAGHG